MNIPRILSWAILALLTAGCATEPDYMPTPAGIEKEQESARSAPVAPPPSTIGLGSFQMIKVGDSKQSVLEAVGSPNIISSSETGGELWVYDKISRSTEAQVGYTSSKSAAAIAQTRSSTMMSTIYFDKDDKVSDIKYRSSRY